MELSLSRKIYLLLAVIVIVAVFFMLVLKFDDNRLAKFSYELNSDGESITISGFDGSNSELEIPQEIDGYKVVAISDHAFANKEKLKKLKIPGTVETIGNYAFDNCSSLQNVELEEGILKIGHYAFYGCSSLKSINLPDGIEEIGDFAFCSCIRLKKIKIPSSCNSIGTDAFAACESLIMDCSENELAYDMAQFYKIPTEFADSDDYLFVKVLVLIAVFGALTAVVFIVLPKIIRKSKKSH